MEKVKFSEFKTWVESQVNKAIYLWGGQNKQLKDLTEDYIDRVETSSANAKRVKKLWNARKDIYPDAYALDCSGLLMHFLQNMKGVCGDKSANSIYKDLCTPISKSELREGDMVFKGTSSKKTHIGYVMDDYGTIASSKGRDYGVIYGETGWKYYARFNYWLNEEPTPTTDAYPITRALKKGYKGEDVCYLQKALNTAGMYGLTEDGSFGSKTLTALKKYQKAKGLTVDGSAGKNTITALYNDTKIVRWAK